MRRESCFRFDDELRWCERLRRGDGEAWREFSDGRRREIEAWFRRRGASSADAPDLTQRALLKVWLGLRRFQYEGEGSFERWLRVVMRRTLLDHFRDSAGRPLARGGDDALHEMEQAPAIVQGGGSSAIDEDGALGERALRLLSRTTSARTGRLIELTVFHDRPVAEAARELGLSPDAARQAKSRALKGLRAMLEQSAKNPVTAPRSKQ